MNLNNNIILLGNKNNPYPFFKDCDIYVQPSRHEGYCITLAEARIFKNNEFYWSKRADYS